MNERKKYFFYKLILILFVFLQGAQVFLYTFPKLKSQEVDSGNLTTATDTLSNSRLSFYGKVSGTYDVNSGTFIMQSSSNPDNNTNHLFPQDVVLIGSNNNKTVATVEGTLQFSTTAKTTNQLANGDAIYATQSATHTVTFTTVSTGNIQGGAIRVLVPAGDSTSASNNSLPDGGATAGFDFNAITAGSVTCPTGGGVTWATATATASATYGNNLHAFECRFYGGTLAAGAYTFTIGGATKLINPAPRSSHTQGTADTYVVKIQQLDYASGYSPVDTVNVSVSPVEAVLVSATINPSLTFSITGQAAGASRCGVTTSVATTATAVPFGELTGSDTFYNAAHLISVSTNATSGYTIKLAEDDDLKKPGTSTYINVGTCDSGSTCSPTSKGQWQTPASNYGWGYSLHTVSGSPTLAFNYDDTSGGNCGGGTTYCAKAFACNNVSGGCSATTAEQTIASSTAPTSAQTFYTCYRLNYGPTQATGYYQTRLLYYALATF